MIGRIPRVLLSSLRLVTLQKTTMATNAVPGEVSEEIGAEDTATQNSVENGKKKKGGGGRGERGRTKTGGGGEEVEVPAKKTKKTKNEAAGSTSGGGGASNSKVTNWSSVDWTELGSTSDGRQWNMKFSSWNVNGVRAWLKNGGFEYISHEAPDIFCLQETKCAESSLPMDQLTVEGYHSYWSSADKPGYSGTGLYCKMKPLKVVYGMGIEKHDSEGRLITCEFDNFYFITTYVPNAGEGLKRLDYRQEWDIDFREYLKKLDSEKPLILSGDLNVAHNEIDLKNPKSNSKTAGFTQQERDGFTALLAEGFVDTFRHLYPTTQAFTYWSYRFNARAKNIGWRLDYFVLSERLMKDVCSCVVRSEVKGSDHCPLVLSMAL